MKRFFLLLIFFAAIRFGVVPFFFANGLGLIALPLRSLTDPLAIPARMLCAVWRSSFPYSIIAASILGPLVLAVVAETLLRHLYDRRSDHDPE